MIKIKLVVSFEFAPQFDGSQPEISDEEKAHVAVSFAAFVDDCILNNITHTRVYGNETSLHMSTGMEGAPRVHINVRNNPDGKDYLKLISLQEVGADGYGSDTVDYRYGTDGIVRRVDLPIPSKDQKKMLELSGLKPIKMGENISLEEISTRAKRGLEIIKEESENFKLESAMGLNNQPIGSRELNKVFNLIESAHPHKLF